MYDTNTMDHFWAGSFTSCMSSSPSGHMAATELYAMNVVVIEEGQNKSQIGMRTHSNTRHTACTAAAAAAADENDDFVRALFL